MKAAVNKTDVSTQNIIQNISNTTKVNIDNIQIKYANRIVFGNIFAVVSIIFMIFCILVFVMIDFLTYLQKKSSSKKIPKKKIQKETVTRNIVQTKNDTLNETENKKFNKKQVKIQKRRALKAKTKL